MRRSVAERRGMCALEASAVRRADTQEGSFVRFQRLALIALSTAVLAAPRLTQAADPTYTTDEDRRRAMDLRPFLIEIEAAYSYIETQAKLSSTLGGLQPILGPGQTTTATIKANDLGGRLRVLGPVLWNSCGGGYGSSTSSSTTEPERGAYGTTTTTTRTWCAGTTLRPFIEGGGSSTLGSPTISSANYGIPGLAPQSNASLEARWQADGAIGVNLDAALGDSILSFKPFVGYAWDSYTAKLNFIETPSGGLVTTSSVKKNYAIGSVEFGGEMAFQPVAAFPLYIFGTGGWRVAVTDYHRGTCSPSPQTITDTACASYRSDGGAFFRGGIGIRF